MFEHAISSKSIKEGNRGGSNLSVLPSTTTGQVVDVKISRGVDAFIGQRSYPYCKNPCLNGLREWVVDEKNARISRNLNFLYNTNNICTSDFGQSLNRRSFNERETNHCTESNRQTMQRLPSMALIHRNKLDVSIYDRLGKLVKKEQKTGPSFNISVADLIIGTYYLIGY